VAQHEDLGVLGDGVPPRQPEESEGAMDQTVEEGEHHDDQPRRLHPGWSRRWLGVSGPFRVDNRRALETLLDEMRDLSREATEQLAAEAGVAFVGPSRPRRDRRRKR